MKITLKNNIIGQLGTGLTKYLNRAFEYINKNYDIEDGIYCEKLIGNRVVVMASIPSAVAFNCSAVSGLWDSILPATLLK